MHSRFAAKQEQTHTPSFAHETSSMGALIEPNKQEGGTLRAARTTVEFTANGEQVAEVGRGGGVRCEAPHTSNRPNAAAASACPCAAARR